MKGEKSKKATPAKRAGAHRPANETTGIGGRTPAPEGDILDSCTTLNGIAETDLLEVRGRFGRGGGGWGQPANSKTGRGEKGNG